MNQKNVKNKCSQYLLTSLFFTQQRYDILDNIYYITLLITMFRFLNVLKEFF